MIGRVRLEPEAEEEIAAAAAHYNEQHVGLGNDFVAAVSAAVRRLARWPNAGTLVGSVAPSLQVRRIRTIRFPYQVVYVRAGDDIYVLAVAHDKRRPGYWASRLE